MELARSTALNVDISSEAEIFVYTYTGAEPAEVMVRVNLGDDSKPINGDGPYILNIYIENIIVSPSSNVEVPADIHRTIMVSRLVPLETGDTISVTVQGQLNDISINAVTSLRNSTPIKTEDVVGSGEVEVNHDYGGEDELSYLTAEGVGVANANIQIYWKEDYDAGRTSNTFVIVRTSTTVGGHWLRSVKLNPGTYTAIFYLPERYGPDRKDFTVT